MAPMQVRCTVCNRSQSTDHGTSLKEAWPKCCGYTMRLESTKEFVAAIESRGIPHLRGEA